MKKLIATLIAVAMVMVLITVPAMATGTADKSYPQTDTNGTAGAAGVYSSSDGDPVTIFGYSVYECTGDTSISRVSQWSSFTDTDPNNVSDFGGMYNVDGYQVDVAAAEFINGNIYGYTGYYSAPEDFFVISFEDFADGNFENAVFTGYRRPEAASTFDIAFDYSTQTMYVVGIDNETAGNLLSKVDLSTGKITDIGPLYTNSDEYEWDFVYNLAIDKDGTAYCMISAAGLDPNGGHSLLVELDLETGEMKDIAVDTEIESFQPMGMCFDHNTGKLYWAQFNTQYSQPCSLYVMDPKAGTIEELGHIGNQNGREVISMFIPYFDDSVELPPVTEFVPDETPTPTPTATPEITPTPTPPRTPTGGITPPPADGKIWNFETEDELEGWEMKDEDKDGNNWVWQPAYFAYDGQGTMMSESRADMGWGDPLKPDNWLISPVFEAGSAVSFYAMSFSNYYAPEPISVYVSTDGGNSWSDELAYFEASGEAFTGYAFDTSAYAGRDIRVAFRHHHDVSEELDAWVMLDYVGITLASDTPPETPTETPTETPSETPTQQPGGETIVWDFDTDAALEGWLVVDADGDGINWGIGDNAEFSHSGTRMALSESFSNNYGPLTPDNYLITPEFTALGGISFYICSVDPEYPGDPVSVYVSTDGGETWGSELANFVSTGEYAECKVDLGDYAGQRICVGFRHYGVTDIYMIALDTVTVEAGSGSGVTPPPTTEPPTTPPVTEPPTTPPVTEEPTTPPVTEEPTPTPPVTEEPSDPTPPVTEEPTEEPPVTDPGTEPSDPGTEPTDPGTEPTEPGTEPTQNPGDQPSVPSTGAISLIGLGVAAIASGAGVVLFRKKQD